MEGHDDAPCGLHNTDRVQKIQPRGLELMFLIELET